MGERRKTLNLVVSRVRGGNRLMWFIERDRPTDQFIETLERIGADPVVVGAARGSSGSTQIRDRDR